MKQLFTTLGHMVCVLTCIFMLSTMSVHAQYKWNRLTAPTSRNGMHAIAISKDGQYVVAAGMYKSILESHDAGVTFQDKTLGNVGDLWSVAFFSAQGTVAVGDDGEVYRRETFNGEWTKQVIAPGTTLNSVEYVGANTLLIGAATGDVFRSTDAGLTWNKITTLPSAIASIASSKTGVCMSVGASGAISISTDNGMTWKPTATQAPSTKSLKRVSYVTDSVWVIAGDTSYFARSTDNGSTWNNIELDTTFSPKIFTITTMSFASATRGVMIAVNYNIPTAFMYCTADGGKTWYSGYNESTGSNNDLFVVTDVKFAENNLTGIASGYLVRVFSIRLIPDSTYFIYDQRDVVSTMMNGPDDMPIFYTPTFRDTYLTIYKQGKSKLIDGFYRQFNTIEERTKDGASLKKWKEEDRFSSTNIVDLSYRSAIYLTDKSIFILADSSTVGSSQPKSYSRLLLTTDEGITWKSITPDSNIRLINPLSKSPTEFMIQQGTSAFYSTSNSGASWKKSELPTGYTSITLLTPTTQSYLAVGVKTDKSNSLLRYTESNNWEEILVNIPLGKRIFTSSRTLLIAGTDKVYLVTISPDEKSAILNEAGAAKDKLTSSSSMALWHQNTLFEVIGNYTMKRSQDSCQSLQNIIPDKLLHYIKLYSTDTDRPISMFTIGNRLYVGMYYGTLLYTEISDTATSVQESSSSSPLPSPYPNPSSISTTLKIPRSLVAGNGALSLKIYSPVGVEMADLTQQLTLQDECITATLRTAEFAPGVYYAVWDGGVIVQKVVVVR